MKILLVARKSLIEILREPQLLGLVLALPIVFVVITAVTYNESLSVVHPLSVINEDTAGEPVLETLEAQRYSCLSLILKGRI